MFPNIRAELLDRIFMARLLHSSFVSSTGLRTTQTLRGLIFVQLYAVYEYTVRTAVDAAFGAITGHSIAFNKLLSGISVLGLESEIAAVVDSKRTASWDRRMRLIDRCLSSDIGILQAAKFPDDGSHFRVGQLRTIWGLLGISVPVVPEPRLLGRIDEIVEHRNAIAHGRRTADDVGGGFSVGDMLARIDDTEAICLHIVNTIEDHCSDAINLQRP